MAITNYERVGKALGLFREGLAPFVARELRNAMQNGLSQDTVRGYVDDPAVANRAITEWDVSALLKLMWNAWRDVFANTLGHAERSLLSELRDFRNKWAHQEPFASDDTDRALDSMARLLTAVSSPQADEINKMKMELRRLIFDEQLRSEKRRQAGTAVETGVTGTLKPWREVVNPHQDVASGSYQQAEFAADLWQVHLNQGTDEYRDPAEFFRRTYLTESLQGLLCGGLKRLSTGGGDPVIQLQTNFGGGKTHSMLALYHLFSGAAPGELLGVDGIMKTAGVESLPKGVRRVVLVGNKISPGNPTIKDDGTVVHTLWGELAWQLGGAEAYKRIQADDELATSPGHVLCDLMNDYGPCLILIDEWVAYARQLHDTTDLPGGSFETHFTFAQTLTESAKLARQCLLVISLPASDTAGSPHTLAEDVEVGGERGRMALERLRSAVGRVEASWRPASAEEGFEIVRRRLFEPLIEQAQFVARDQVAQAFHDLYRTQSQEFPSECNSAEYEKRIQAAYPIHPEVFDRLYTDWSTLVKFQRTRGVLRLMAAVIHSLWEKGDRNPMILPANITIDDPRVQSELTRYLSDNWAPIIDKDVDGPNALPSSLDKQFTNLGKLSACRRVARTIYLGSAPTTNAANRGMEDRRVKLGCVMPGEAPAVFGDALRRLSAAATYLYQDGARYWYSTQPTVTKLADDRAEEYRRNPDAVLQELDKRLRENLSRKGDFARIHPLPQSGQDVPDDMEAHLVVLGPDAPYSKEPHCPAERAAQAIFESRGNTPRLYRNTLVFLAADLARLTDLDEALRQYLAWQSIVSEQKELNLDPHQGRQAEARLKVVDGTVTSRLPETYQWLLVPVQETPQAALEWQPLRLTGADALAVRASKKLQNERMLLTSLAGTLLRMDLDRIPLWAGNHVSIAQLAEHYARYTYLWRLVGPDVLNGAVRDGLSLLLWHEESFAYADSYDEETGRYVGLRANQRIDHPLNNHGLVVKPDVAQWQIEEDERRRKEPVISPQPPKADDGPGEDPSDYPPKPKQPRRYYGTVTLNEQRVGRDAGKIAEEVIAHLVGLQGSRVTITLEIAAEIPAGVPDTVVRTVTENGRVLKFVSQGFEEE
jgi:predicted AAA+ superfamily ATPase